MEVSQHTRKLAKSVLDELVALGCQDSQKVSGALGRTVFFDHDGLRLKKDQLAAFARAIRKATSLEHAGAFQANIDRMGKVIGWHHSPNPDGTTFREASLK
jgi:hypothetical protein